MEPFNDTVQNYWHLYSDGKRADIPFLTEEDKTFAWNTLAICAFRNMVRILVDIVNDTHLHALVYGEEADALHFRDDVRHRILSRYKKGGMAEKLGDGFFLACDPVGTRRELLQKFMYVYRNCLDFFPSLPWEYSWGAGNIFFVPDRRKKGRPLSSFSQRELLRLLRTKTPLPQDWRSDDLGALDPASFIDFRHVERIFGSVRTFLAFLSVKKDEESEMKQAIHARYQSHRTMEDLRGRGNRISLRLCGKTLIKAPFAIRLRTAQKLIREGSATLSESLAKAVYLKLEDLQKLL